MYAKEFDILFNNYKSKERVPIQCEDCQSNNLRIKEKVKASIVKYGYWLCRSCSMKRSHTKNPTSDKTKQKQRIGRLGKKHSDASKQQMTRAKLSFYQTPQGTKLKKKLSILTSQGHAKNKFENAKRQGWYESKKAQKKVFYGSSYELRLCWQLDQDDQVKIYSTQIPYKMNDKGRCLDFLVEYWDGTKKAIEVKPQTRLNEQANIEQINDSREYAKANGWSFEVCTELYFNMTGRELRIWADEYRSKTGEVDYVSQRKELDRKKANRHYANVISQDTLVIFCEYCQEEHHPLRLTHDKNIARNGRYICERKGGHIAGSQPKKKKINPHASYGKKECTKCHAVKIFDEFGFDKSRSDGYANRCKLCRTKGTKV